MRGVTVNSSFTMISTIVAHMFNREVPKLNRTVKTTWENYVNFN